MRINAARVERGELIISTPDIREAFRFIATFKPGKIYEIILKHEKRSKDANAYMWVLCTALGAAVHMSKEEVYFNAIRQVGTYKQWNVPEADADEFCRLWRTQGTGWPAEIVDDSAIPGCKLVNGYYGSSTYDTAQMSKLIDHIVEDCYACEVETKPKEYIDSLLAQWEPKEAV